MFNEYLFHLCDCTCLNVICVCSITCWSNQKYFSVFYLFLEVNTMTLVLKSFSQKAKFFLLKNLVFGNFTTQLTSGCIPSKSWVEMRKFQFLHKIKQRVSWLSRKCFTNQTWPAKSALCICTFHNSTHKWLMSHWLAKYAKRQF